MLIQRNTSRSGNRRALPSTLVKYCLAVFFGLSVFGHYFVQPSFNATHKTVLAAKGISVSDPASRTPHYPLDPPIVAEPDNSEGPENELNNDAGYGIDLFCLGAIPADVFLCSIAKSSFSNFVSHVQNRETVSLVVLHHSWKGFIA